MMPDALTGGKVIRGQRSEAGGRQLAEGSGETVEELAKKVAEGQATDEERKRLGELLRA